MRMQTAAHLLFAKFIAITLGQQKWLFDRMEKTKERKGIKQFIGTRRVIHTCPGPYRRNKVGPQGKAAKKEYRKLTHIKGYYAKQRKGELIV